MYQGIWQNKRNPPIISPGRDLTFGTHDEGPEGQFEEPVDFKSSKKSINPSTNPGITEPEAQNSSGNLRKHNTPSPKGSSLTGGNKYHPRSHTPTGMGIGENKACGKKGRGRGHLETDKQSPLHCRFCGQSGHTMTNCYKWEIMCNEHRARSMAPMLDITQDKGNPIPGNHLGHKAPHETPLGRRCPLIIGKGRKLNKL